MKKFMIVYIVLAVCLLSCKKEKVPRFVSISTIGMRTNYYNNDSIQKKDGYYPAIIYMLLSIHNTSDDTLFLPQKTLLDSSSFIKISFGNDKIDSRCVSYPSKGILLPHDSTSMVMAAHICKKNTSDILPMLKNCVRNINLEYIIMKSDSSFSKYPMPDSIIFNINRNLKLDYRDIDSFGEQIEWI